MCIYINREKVELGLQTPLKCQKYHILQLETTVLYARNNELRVEIFRVGKFYM